MTLDEIHGQINLITSKLIEADLSLDYKYPSRSSTLITCSGECTSDYFKQENKYEVYRRVIQNKDYNILLFDGSFIQFMYKFRTTRTSPLLIEHRLQYFACPLKITIAEIKEAGPELGLLDIFDGYDLKTFSGRLRLEGFIRFDYDLEAARNVEHPESHLHLCKDHCRIPVYRPLSPINFVQFVFRNLYPDEWRLHNLQDILDSHSHFHNSITQDEKKIMHVNW